jgi:hypothetical protein
MDNILDNYKSIMEFFGIKTDNMVLKLCSVYQERYITASSISIFVEGCNTNNTDLHEITEILLKVTLNTINQTNSNN